MKNLLILGFLATTAVAQLPLIMPVTESVEFNELIGAGGDVDGDGIPDLWGFRHQPTAVLSLISGADGAIVYSLPDVADFVPLGDQDGDGTPDVATFENVPTPTEFCIRSGATTSILHHYTAPALLSSLANVKDFDGDGRDDVMFCVLASLLGAFGSPTVEVQYLSSFGFVIGPPVPLPYWPSYAPVGAQLGSTEFVAVTNFHSPGIDVITFNGPLYSLPTPIRGTLNPVGDVDGDGDPDVILVESNLASSLVISPLGNSVVHFLGPGSVSGLGDLNGDGHADLARSVGGDFEVLSGADLSVMWAPSLYGYPGNSLGDFNGDGFDDLVVASGFAMPGQGLTPGVYTMCGRHVYGTGNPNHVLSMDWVHNGVNADPADGMLVISGAQPASTGLLVIGAAQAAIPFLGVDLLVQTPSNGGTYSFSPSGETAILANLRQPPLAGFAIYAQMFEANPAGTAGLVASEGLGLQFCR